MDIAMPLLNGLEATRQIRKAVPATKVLILSAHSDDAYVKQATEFGAVGFLLKQTSAHESGRGDPGSPKRKHIFQPRHFQTRFRARWPEVAGSSGEAASKTTHRLSSREMEVLQLIAEGKANKQVAAELGISIKTVEKHRQHLMEKLEHPRHRRPHPLRHQCGHHRKQCPVDHLLAPTHGRDLLPRFKSSPWPPRLAVSGWAPPSAASGRNASAGA